MFGLPPDAKEATFRQKVKRWLRSWPGVVFLFVLFVGGPGAVWLLIEPPYRGGAGDPALDIWIADSVFHFTNQGTAVWDITLSVTTEEPGKEYTAELSGIRYGYPKELSCYYFIADDGTFLRPWAHVVHTITVRGQTAKDETYETVVDILPADYSFLPAISLNYEKLTLTVKNNSPTPWSHVQAAIRYADAAEEFFYPFVTLATETKSVGNPVKFRNSAGDMFPVERDRQSIISLTAVDPDGETATFSLTIDNLLE